MTSSYFFRPASLFNLNVGVSRLFSTENGSAVKYTSFTWMEYNVWHALMFIILLYSLRAFTLSGKNRQEEVGCIIDQLVWLPRATYSDFIGVLGFIRVVTLEFVG